MSKSLSEIIKNRKSIRAYTDKPVSNELIKDIYFPRLKIRQKSKNRLIVVNAMLKIPGN